MSCWVVPSVAADYWRVSLEDLWERIRAGLLPSRVENGFTVVDVAPDAGESRLAVIALKQSAHPPTFSDRPSEIGAAEEQVPADGAIIEKEHAHEMGDWRKGRHTASARRRAPSREAASAAA